MSWSRGAGRRRPSCAPTLLISEAPVQYESANCSGGTALKGFLRTGTDRRADIHVEMHAIITI